MNLLEPVFLASVTSKCSLADLGGGREGRTPPPGRPNSFDFMQFSGKFGVFTPPLEGSRPPLGKILDPPLVLSLSVIDVEILIYLTSNCIFLHHAKKFHYLTF